MTDDLLFWIGNGILISLILYIGWVLSKLEKEFDERINEKWKFKNGESI